MVASLFVNPAQFGDPADLATYPRDAVRDETIAREAAVDVLFAPAAEEIYPPGFATWVDVEGAAIGFEGEHRPGHFRGVATVCLKLFSIVAPEAVFLGQKDAQQVAVLQQVVRDLNLPMAVRVVPTVRDADGLALSCCATSAVVERRNARARSPFRAPSMPAWRRIARGRILSPPLGRYWAASTRNMWPSPISAAGRRSPSPRASAAPASSITSRWVQGRSEDVVEVDAC